MIDPAIDRRAILDRSWQLLAHVCQLRDAGDHVVADLGGLPVIAVRGADGEIRVFHNVCRHRAGPIAQLLWPFRALARWARAAYDARRNPQTKGTRMPSEIA